MASALMVIGVSAWYPDITKRTSVFMTDQLHNKFAQAYILWQLNFWKRKKPFHLLTWHIDKVGFLDLLGVGLLQQGAPEFVLGLGVHEDELPISCRQKIVDDDVNPLSVPPEPEVENSAIFFRFLVVPFLVFVVRNDLYCKMKNVLKHRIAT